MPAGVEVQPDAETRARREPYPKHICPPADSLRADVTERDEQVERRFTPEERPRLEKQESLVREHDPSRPPGVDEAEDPEEHAGGKKAGADACFESIHNALVGAEKSPSRRCDLFAAGSLRGHISA